MRPERSQVQILLLRFTCYMSESLSYKDSGIFLYPVPAGFHLNPNYILRIYSPKLRAKHFHIHPVHKFLRNLLKKSRFVPAYCRTAFSFIKVINSSTVSRLIIPRSAKLFHPFSMSVSVDSCADSCADFS